MNKDNSSVFKKYVEILKNQSFLRFFIAQFISTLGDWMLFSVLIFFVYNLTGKAFSVALLAIFKILPAVLFTPFTAIIVDRYDRKKLMIIADLVRAVLIAMLPFFPRLEYILFTMFAQETFSILYLPSRDASIPTVVPEKHLIVANALMTLTTNLTMILGFLFGSLFIDLSMKFLRFMTQIQFISRLMPVVDATLAAKMVFFIDSLTFCMSAMLVWRTALPPIHEIRAKKEGATNWRQELKDIWAFYTSNPFVSTIMVTIGILIVGIGTIYALGVPYCDNYLGAGGQKFGYLIAALGLGMVFGSVAAEPVSKFVRRIDLFIASPFAVGICFFFFALVKNFMFALFLGFVAGTGLATITVVTYAILQQRIDNTILGRVFTALVLVMRMSLIISLVVSSLLSDLISLIGVKLGPSGNGFLKFELQGPVITLFLGGVFVTWAGFYAWKRLRKAPQLQAAAGEDSPPAPEAEAQAEAPMESVPSLDAMEPERAEPAASEPAASTPVTGEQIEPPAPPQEAAPSEKPAYGEETLTDDDIASLP